MNMVRFKSKVDRNGRVYLPKPIRETLTDLLEIQPNASAAIIYKAGTSLSDVLFSIKIIATDLEHQLQQKEV